MTNKQRARIKKKAMGERNDLDKIVIMNVILMIVILLLARV